MTDEIPVEYIPLRARRTLWQEYGIKIDDLEYAEVVMALRLHNAEANHQAVKMRQMMNNGR